MAAVLPWLWCSGVAGRGPIPMVMASAGGWRVRARGGPTGYPSEAVGDLASRAARAADETGQGMSIRTPDYVPPGRLLGILVVRILETGRRPQRRVVRRGRSGHRCGHRIVTSDL